MNLEFYRGKRVFVTGHTGFKGSWLCRMLVGVGAVVTGYSLEPPTTPNLFSLAGLEGKMTSVIGDIRDFASLKAAFDAAQPEIVLHLAAQPIVRDSSVASSHPLAGKNSVTLPELTHFPVILLQAGANRRASSQIARWLMGLGWTKDALRFADTIEDQLLMINLNQGISFMPQGSYPVGIRLIPIVSDTPILHHTEAVMRQMTPLHLQFVEQLRQADMAERHP